MLIKLLSLLFRNNEYSYVAHPAQVLLGILIMTMGMMTLTRDGWIVFGVLSVVIGFVLCIVVMLSILWDKATRYWETINDNLSIALRLNDPNLKWEILAKLGYKEPQKNITVIETTPQTKEAGWQQRISNLSVPPAVMNQLSNKVLMSKDLTFSEPKYGNLVPKFRKVSKQWQKDGLLAQKNSKNPRLGFSFTKKGVQVLYQYADEMLKLQIEKDNRRDNA